MHDYIIAAIGDWNKLAYEKVASQLNGNWFFCTEPNSLNLLLSEVKPRYIFFLHWRWIVPRETIINNECVCFHMTDVPYGRGGSPLQNLIVRGHTESTLTALRMEEGLDTGPVYFKQKFKLDGSAHQIYQHVSKLSIELISTIVEQQPTPIEQFGEVVTFKRRTPEQSRIPDGLNEKSFYDYIRMLDAPGYPKAFIEVDNYIMEFSNAGLDKEKLTASVNIRIKE